ncbi:MAG: DUF87 domain-containing protein [Candidatus Nanoarchaeia archaeon]|nr:DUF87 domain-containing protein [Candidatus Nanoarchaeia archaeon]
MSYEIPQQLEYKERIIFNLTFKQLAYAFFFAIAIGLIYKLNLDIYFRSFIAIIPLGLAVSFMFFDLETRLKDWFLWFKFRGAKFNTKQLVDYLEVSKVDSNLIHINKNKVAVLKVKPVNFHIKTKEEQEVVIKSFQKFLNSIDFPIQILMTTDNIDLEDYFSGLNKRVTKEHIDLFNDYKAYLHSIVSDSEIINRNFYLVIPEAKNIDIQLTICKERLETIGLKSERLNNQELTNLIANSFNAFKLGNGLSFYDSIMPKEVKNNIDNLVLGNKLNRIINAHGYPRNVEPGFLDKLVTAKGDFDLALHINPYPIEDTMVMLNRELQKQKADLYASEMKEIINPSLEIQYADTRSVLENLQKGNDKLFNISLYVNCKAENEAKLNLLTKKVESELNSILVIPKIPRFRMAKGIKALAPFGQDRLNISRNITTKALSAFFPFTSTFLQVDNKGVWFGNNKNNVPIIRDIFKLRNPNGTILASSGAGKSYMAKLFISRHLLNGTKVLVIDPQSEYRNLVNQFNGELVELSKDSKTIINPLDLMGHDFAEKRLALLDLFKIMLGTVSELTEPQRAFLDHAIGIAYEEKGITNDPKTWSNEPPILSDVADALKSMHRTANNFEKATIRSIENRLEMYTNGVFSFLNKQTKINFDKDFVCFDIGDMPRQVKPVIMFLVLDYLYMKMKKSKERKLLVIDESWSLLSKAEEESYIFEIVKTCRKFNLGLLLINQEAEGLLTSKAGRSVLANSAYTILMRQTPSVIRDAQKTFNLSELEKDKLLTSGLGEGILIMEDDHSELKVMASKKEHEVITTNADELLLSESKETKSQVVEQPAFKRVNIRVDATKGFFKKSEITDDEIIYLKNKGYIESTHMSIDRKIDRYLLELKANENAGHCFLLNEIYYYIRKFTDKVWKYHTLKPDIIFIDKQGRKIAIEVETGKVYRKNKRQFAEKVANLNKNYNDWFFVLTDKNYISEYSQFGKCYDKRNIAHILKSDYF